MGKTVVEEGYRELGLLDADAGALFVPGRRPGPDGETGSPGRELRCGAC
jgi:hypothetical protein